MRGAALEQRGESERVDDTSAEIESWRPEKLIVRVDRTAPAKTLVRGFLAYERLLEDHPEHHGRVALWAFLQPSRQDVDAYRDYLQVVTSTVDRINLRFGRQDWTPTRLDLSEDLHQAVAAYRSYDALLVNPILDALNLVPKEGPVGNQRS